MGKVGKSSELRLPRILDFFCWGGGVCGVWNGGVCIVHTLKG